MRTTGSGEPIVTMRWARLDLPGSDACTLTRSGAGWHLEGSAIFGAGRDAARLNYSVHADDGWITTRGTVRGTAAGRDVSIEIERLAGGAWHIDGGRAPALDGLIDLDLGFTPATNLFPLRRLALQPGQSADAAAAWLDESSWTFRRLPQRYERRDETRYWYESPSTGYQGLLVVDARGFVIEYPELWQGVSE